MSITQLPAQYKSKAKEEILQGETQSTQVKSGHYNTQDTCTADLSLLWPNEGVVGGVNKRRVTYDYLSLPQWVVGQLQNILQISDIKLMKDVIQQVIYSMQYDWPTFARSTCSLGDLDAPD